MNRGDLVTIAPKGDYGKPRPGLIIQSNAFAALPSVTVLQMTSTIHDEHIIRITVDPTPENGLRKTSQVMVDRAVTLPREKIGPVFGRVSGEILGSVDKALMRFFGLSNPVA